MPLPPDPLADAARTALTTTASGTVPTTGPSGYLDISGGLLSNRGNLSKPQSKGSLDHWADNPDAYDHVILAGKPLLGLCRLKGKGFEQRLHRKKIAGRNGESVRFIALEPAEFHIEWDMWMPSHWQAYQKLIPTLKTLKRLPAKKPPVVLDASQDESAGLATYNIDSGGFVHNEGSVVQYLAAYKTAYGGTGSGADPKLLEMAAKVQRTETSASQPSFATPIVPVYHPFLAALGISLVHILRLHIPEDKDGKGTYVARIECLEAYPPQKTKSKVEVPRTLDVNALKTLLAQKTGQPQFTTQDQKNYNPPPSNSTDAVGPQLG